MYQLKISKAKPPINLMKHMSRIQSKLQRDVANLIVIKNKRKLLIYESLKLLFKF